MFEESFVLGVENFFRSWNNGLIAGSEAKIMAKCNSTSDNACLS